MVGMAGKDCCSHLSRQEAGATLGILQWVSRTSKLDTKCSTHGTVEMFHDQTAQVWEQLIVSEDQASYHKRTRCRGLDMKNLFHSFYFCVE